jgi:2-keto-3-deoxy-L-rhamnonate aldolase RhmA
MTGPVPTTALRRRLDDGGVAVVVAGHAMTSDTVDFVGQLGFDAVWLEGEHGAVTWDRIGDLGRAAELWGMAALLRVRTLDPTLIVRGLSLGAHGIVVPQVTTADEARVAVAAARFAPEGRRGVTRGRRSYRSVDASGPDHHFAVENANAVVVVQLEDPEALSNIDEITSVDGLDVVFVAPNDLAQSMGRQGQLDHPDVVAAIDAGLARIAATGKVAGTLCQPQHIDRFVALGARLLYVSLDGWIRAGAADYRVALEAAAHRTGS